MTYIPFISILQFAMLLSSDIQIIQSIIVTEIITETTLQQSHNVPDSSLKLVYNNISETAASEINLMKQQSIELNNRQVPLQFINSNNYNNNNDNSKDDGNTMELISAIILKQQQQSQAIISQQNVMQLINNMDEYLRQMRSVELEVTNIQEIFDSLHFTSRSRMFSPNDVNNVHVVLNKNETLFMNGNNNNHSWTWENNIQHDLAVFTDRIKRKLDKAIKIINELYDFFRINITSNIPPIVMDNFMEAKQMKQIVHEEKTHMTKNRNNFYTQFDINFNGTGVETIEAVEKDKSINLKTVIELCHDQLNKRNDKSDWTQTFLTTNNEIKKNYNKKQIQILNYDRNDKRHNDIDISLNNKTVANDFIREKLNTVKMKLIKNDKLNIERQQQQDRRWDREIPIDTNTKYFDNHLKRIYFLSSSDIAIMNNNIDYPMHLRYIYTSSIQRKYVFLLLDIGSDMTMELMESARSFISLILQLLSTDDLISLLTINEEIDSMVLLEANGNDAANGLFWATKENTNEILSYIHSLMPTTSRTNHSLAFDYALRMLARLENMNLISTEQPIQFIYITRGLITNSSDTKHILNIISNGQRSLKQPIVINACVILPDEKQNLYKKEFFNDIVEQNYAKYNVNVTMWLKKYKSPQLNGKMFILSKYETSKKFMNIAMSIFERHFREPYITKKLQIHKPITDDIYKESLVSMSYAISPYGVVGVDLYFYDLIEDIVSYELWPYYNRYHHQQQHHQQHFVYAFLIEMDGNTLIHPALPQGFTTKQAPYPIDIGYLENSTDFINIRRRLLNELEGNATTIIYMPKNHKHINMERSYHWKSIYNIYVLCVVTTYKKNNDLEDEISLPLNIQKERGHYTINQSNITIYKDSKWKYSDGFIIDGQLIYHRLDLLPLMGNVNLCRYFHQLATYDAATLFLSSTAFKSPFTYLHNNRLSSIHAQLRTMESIMAYLKDATGLLANPGLKPHIRQEVNVLYRAMQFLKKRHQDVTNPMRQYIIRRYIASMNGVLQMFPGSLLNSNYDPRQRPWFKKAIKYPGKIIATKPYLDAASSGYIITIAYTLFEGKPNALHSNSHDQPIAIVAMDITYAYFYKIILNSVPLCQMANIKCLMFENEGYLIAHPTMLEPSTHLRNYRRPHEHLTHKESYLASDILNHKKLVRKLACANYQNRTLQRYYIFNTSLTDILTNVVHGERTKYAIALVKGTNIFAAVLNSTCDGGAFCPCSTIDRQCLNCKRMDPIDCECPCECPMPSATRSNDDNIDFDSESNTDTNNISDNNEHWPNSEILNITHHYLYCETSNEEPYSYGLEQNWNMANHHQSLLLPSCLNINCEVFITQKDCLAVMGCEWCQQDIEGDRFFTPFCATQSSCFNGVMASFSPYGDLDASNLLVRRGFQPSPQNITTYSAIGPIGGAIIILSIVVGFIIYCYRHNIDNVSQEQFYMDSMQEENYGLPLSRFTFDDCQAPDESCGRGGNGGGNGVSGGNNGRGGNAGSCSYDHNNAQRTLINAADVSPYHMSTGSSYRRPPNGESDQGYSTMTPHEDSSDHQCFTLAEPLLSYDKRNSKSDTISISTSISSPTNRQQQQTQPMQFHKENSSKSHITSPNKKYHTHSPHRQQQHQTQFQKKSDNLNDNVTIPTPGTTRLILVPVTVHRHMETSES